MREIKFRAWDKRENRWRGMWIFRGGHTTEQRYYNEPEIFDLSSCFSDCILMQFTGLKDKNGKEIYEGDILEQAVPLSGRYIDKGFVEFSKGFFIIKADSEEHQIVSDWIKIIGNIYENPELLKKEQK